MLLKGLEGVSLKGGESEGASADTWLDLSHERVWAKRVFTGIRADTLEGPEFPSASQR